MRLLPFIIFLLSPFLTFASEDSCTPVPEDAKSHYSIDLKKWFYVDDEARKQDIAEIQRMKTQIADLRPELSQSSAKLLEAIRLNEKMGIIAKRLRTYGKVRLAIDTNDSKAKEIVAEALKEYPLTGNPVAMIVQELEERKLRKFIVSSPELSQYEFLLQSWRRDREHTAPVAVETLLAELDPMLDPFDGKFYEQMLKRTSDTIANITVGSQTLRVTTAGDYADLLRQPDRKMREQAFFARMAAFKAEEDLYAFGLYQKAQSANAVEAARHFPNAVDSALFEYYLTPEMLDRVLRSFRDHASLAIRFQKAEHLYQESLLSIDHAQPWDLEARPTGAPEPCFQINDGTKAVSEALDIFGKEYKVELEEFLNPQNGRMDIVSGKNRGSGDYTWRARGASVVSMQSYRAHVADVVTLAHESAHVVHNSLLDKSGVSWYFSDGARYFTEGFAKVNELLILDLLAKKAETDPDRLFYLHELASKLASVEFASMYWAAYATSFETEVYRRIQDGKIKEAKDIHDVWAEYGRLWMLNFEQYPDLKYTWAATPHFFKNSRHYFEYLFAWLLALSVYERLDTDPGFSEKFVRTMKAGFYDEPHTILRTHLGIDLTDPGLLDRLFSLVEKRIRDFERLLQAGSR